MDTASAETNTPIEENKPKTVSSEKTVEVKEQEKFYGDKRLWILVSLGATAVLVVGLLQLIFVLRSSAVPDPAFFAVSNEEQLIKEVPLDESNMEENVLLNWVVQVVMDANTFNYVDYSRIIGNVKPYFTLQGYKAYSEALSKAEIIKRITEQKLVLSAVPIDSPYVVLEKPFSGRYMWKVKVPMRFRFQSLGYETYDNMEVTMVIMRVPARTVPVGVQVLKYELEMIDRF